MRNNHLGEGGGGSNFLLEREKGGIHQKMFTALFKLILNTQKTTRTNFFEYQSKMFLNIEKVLVKISEEQP